MVQSILANKKAHVEKIQALFSHFDDREMGVITFAMLEEKIDSPDVREYFETLGLDVWDAWSFFKSPARHLGEPLASMNWTTGRQILVHCSVNPKVLFGIVWYSIVWYIVYLVLYCQCMV